MDVPTARESSAVTGGGSVRPPYIGVHERGPEGDSAGERHPLPGDSAGERPPLIAESAGERPPLIAESAGERPPLIAVSAEPRSVYAGGERAEPRSVYAGGERAEPRSVYAGGERAEPRSGHAGGEPRSSHGERAEARQPVGGRRDTVLDSYRDGVTSLREESARAGYERAWHALSGYERAPSPEGPPHPISGYERLSVERAHTMKDFEKQITELKKENFNLKLRIYFLEEQVQRRCDTSNDELHRMNIELKVEVESLKHDFQEKHNLLVRASKAMESLAGEHELAVQRLREEHLKHLQDLEDSHKLQLLQAEAENEKAELGKVCVLLDQERMQRFTAEERLMTVNEQYTKSMAILEERDWIIQCLNDTVHSKDALIAQLEKQIASMMPNDASMDKMEKNISNLYLEGDAKDSSDPPNPIRSDGKEENVNEWQEKIKEMDNLINELQQKLEANKAGLAAEEKNSLKRDKAIQGLTAALKKKTKENEKLLSEIDNLNVVLSKAREAAQQAQRQSLKENVHPEYKKLIFTLQAEEDMYSRLLKYERESGSLQKELESIAMLRRWLEENIQANQELRKIMEAQIMGRYKGDDSMSFLGDQTSYLSICLDHLDQNEYFFAGGPQGSVAAKNNMLEAFNHLREEAGTQTQNDISALVGGNLKHQQDYNSDLSFSERSTLLGENYENDAKPARSKPSTISSATQTEPTTFSDKYFALDVSRFPNERQELTWTLQDGGLNIPSQRLPQKKTNTTCEVQEYNFSRNAKKSRLPVPIKSSRNTKLKTDVALTLAKEDGHGCLEKDLQIEHSQAKCAEIEVELFKENRDSVCENHVPDQNNSGQETVVHTDQQLEKHRLSEESKRAGSESTTPEASEEVLGCKASGLHNSTEQALKELQVANYRLSEQLEQAQIENRTLKANEELLRIEASGHGRDIFKDEQRMATEQTLQTELQAENYQLSEQLKHAQMEIKALQASAELIKHKDALPDRSGSILEPRESTDHKLKAENYRMTEQLQQAQREIETLKANEEMLRKTISERDSRESKDEQRKLTEQALQTEQQEERYQLSEQLKQAQIEIKTLQANAELIEHKHAVRYLSGSMRWRSDEELQAENYRLYEQLILAQTEIETLKANEKLLRSKSSEIDLNNSKDEQKKSTEQALQKELQAENDRLSEQLKQAQMEIETFRAKEELLRCRDSEHDLHNINDEWRKVTEQALQKELQTENHRLSEQLKQAQEIESFKAKEELLRCKVSEHDLHNSKDEWRKSIVQASQKELQAENHRLSEQLKWAHKGIEIFRAKEELFRCEVSEHDLHVKDEWRMSTEQALQKELQAENHRLSEQLKRAQIEIEALKANEELMTRKNAAPDMSYSLKDSTTQSLQKELQAEQCRLSEKLKTAQMEIEKLQAERRSTGSSDDSLKLHGSDADDDLSEQSFLDKTITNTVNVVEVDATSDFGDEVCRPDVISHNAVALRCHHDSHCTECANNRGSLPLPTSKSKRASTRHSSSKYTKVSSGRSFEDTTSLSKYDLLVQSQARELSLQRQKIKESHNLSVICSKNFYNILKAFENLFPASTLDSNITLGFQEQITQTVEWLKELEYKLSDAFYGEEDAYSDHSVDSLLYTPSRLVPGHRMWADKHGCHVLGLVEDYNALRKQILEAANVLQEMEAFIDHGVQTAVLNMTEHFGNIFFEKLTRTKQSLEEAGCLLKLLWRVSLPLQIRSPYSINQEEDMNLEVSRLRKRVVEQEKLLSGMVKRVYSENQVKEDIEKLIMDQLAMTHDILKRAKGNLEVQVVDKLH